MSRPIPANRAARFAADFIKDLVSGAWADQWRKRAETFEAAAPRPGDFTGRASSKDLEDRRTGLRETALACRNRAAVIELGGEEW